jgi:hypothetical protein
MVGLGGSTSRQGEYLYLNISAPGTFFSNRIIVEYAKEIRRAEPNPYEESAT